MSEFWREREEPNGSQKGGEGESHLQGNGNQVGIGLFHSYNEF